jgi:hypothetical protein
MATEPTIYPGSASPRLDTLIEDRGIIWDLETSRSVASELLYRAELAELRNRELRDMVHELVSCSLFRTMANPPEIIRRARALVRP